MARDIPKMWARRMEAEMKDWDEPVAPTEQQHGRMVFPDTLPCEVERGESHMMDALRYALLAPKPKPSPWWVRCARSVRRYFRNLWRALRGEGL